MGMFRGYQIVGRLHPNIENHAAVLHRMKIWAADPLRARSKFWFFMRRIRKIQKTKGQIISCREIFERKPTVSKNFCVWISYASRTGNHNAYKEYRDLSLN